MKSHNFSTTTGTTTTTTALRNTTTSQVTTYNSTSADKILIGTKIADKLINSTSEERTPSTTSTNTPVGTTATTSITDEIKIDATEFNISKSPAVLVSTIFIRKGADFRNTVKFDFDI